MRKLKNSSKETKLQVQVAHIRTIPRKPKRTRNIPYAKVTNRLMARGVDRAKYLNLFDKIWHEEKQDAHVESLARTPCLGAESAYDKATQWQQLMGEPWLSHTHKKLKIKTQK